MDGPNLAHYQPIPQYLIPGHGVWLCLAQPLPALPGPVALLHPAPFSLAVNRDQASGLDIVKQLQADTDTYMSVKIMGYCSVCVMS